MKICKSTFFISQYLVAFSATLFSLAVFSAVSWSSPSIPKLLAPDSPVKITPDEGSWLVSLIKIGGVISPIPASWMMDRIGRKSTLLVGAVPLILGWILIGCANSIGVLYLARLLSSLGYGIDLIVTPMYLGEIASDNVRGFITAIVVVMSKMGVMYAYSIGPYVSIRTMSWLGLIPVTAFLLMFSWQPESPYYYLGKNRKADARRSLVRLRGTENIEDELNRMEVAVKKSQEHPGTFKELFSTKVNRSGLLIGLALGSCVQLCGSQSIIGYAETIFNKIGSDLRGSEATIVMGILQIIFALISSSVMDIIGRRPLLLFSLTGITICNTVLAVYFNLGRNSVDVSPVAWAATGAVFLFTICYTLGLPTVTSVLLGETIPKNLKAVAGITYGMTVGSVGFVTLKLFQVVSDGLGFDYIFFGFAFFPLLLIPFAWFMVPETKGKSLDLILVELSTSRRTSCQL